MLGHAVSRPVRRVADVERPGRRERFDQGDGAAGVEGSAGQKDRHADVVAVPKREAPQIRRERLEEGRGDLAVISGKEKHLGRLRDVLAKIDSRVVDVAVQCDGPPEDLGEAFGRDPLDRQIGSSS